MYKQSLTSRETVIKWLGQGLKHNRTQLGRNVLFWVGLALVLPLSFTCQGAWATGTPQGQSSRQVKASPHGFSITALNPTRLGYPSRRRGGGSRSNASQSSQSLAVVVGEGNGASLTMVSQPSLTFYVAPEESAQPVEVVLENNQRQVIYRHQLSPGHSGFMTLDLAQEVQAPHLELGARYTWRLSLVRDETDRASDLVIERPVQFVAAEVRPASSGAFAWAEALLSQGLIQDGIAELTRLQSNGSEPVKAQADSYLKQLLLMPSEL